MSGETQTMALSELLHCWRPGSRDDWTWEQEYAQLWLHDGFWKATHELAESIRTTGIQEPVLLGNDGRVWDGHHRIVIAMHLRFETVPVRMADGVFWRYGHPCVVHDICVDEPGCILYPGGEERGVEPGDRVRVGSKWGTVTQCGVGAVRVKYDDAGGAVFNYAAFPWATCYRPSESEHDALREAGLA